MCFVFINLLTNAFLFPPLISSYLIALVLLKSSLLLTDKWRGVRPFPSTAFISASHATIKLSANSAPAKAAQ